MISLWYSYWSDFAQEELWFNFIMEKISDDKYLVHRTSRGEEVTQYMVEKLDHIINIETNELPNG